MGKLKKILFSLTILKIVGAWAEPQLFVELGSPYENLKVRSSRQPSSSHKPSSSQYKILNMNLFSSEDDKRGYVRDATLGPGGDGEGPLNYQKSSSSEDYKIRPPSKSSSIFSQLMYGDSPKRPYRSSSSGSSSSSTPFKHTVSEGYTLGLPLDYEGYIHQKQANSKKRPFRLFSFGSSSSTPTRSAAAPPPNSYFTSLNPPKYVVSPSESLPIRIRNGIMGFLRNSPLSSMSSESTASGPSFKHGHSMEELNSESGSSLFYLSPPKPKSSRPNPFRLVTSESRRYQKNLPISSSHVEDSYTSPSTGPYLIIPQIKLISPKNKLVMATKTDGSPVILELAPNSPDSSDGEGEVESSSSVEYSTAVHTPPRTVQYFTTSVPSERQPAVVEYKASVPIQYITIPTTSYVKEERFIQPSQYISSTGSNSIQEQEMRLDSRPDISFPSITMDNLETLLDVTTYRPSDQGDGSVESLPGLTGEETRTIYGINRPAASSSSSEDVMTKISSLAPPSVEAELSYASVKPSSPRPEEGVEKKAE